jgi:glutamyl-tRNA synthetase/glutamyl-Q tRNA(Asp) synthetase
MSVPGSRLRSLAPLIGRAPVTRYAPSPTGRLHLGHVVNAIFVWGLARATGGRVLLRIEDHDRTRCRPGLEAALLDDLAWLGFVPDEGRLPIHRQSDRDERYRDALEQLRRVAHVYACACSRREIGGERYDGRCRHRALAPGKGRGIRVQIPAGVERTSDPLAGELAEDPSVEYGDLLVRDRHGCWTYQFAVTVDDLQDGVTLVIRGADLASSTGRQLALARLLERQVTPLFVHHPLILKPDGAKLSKATGDAGIAELRAAGQSPAQVIGLAAAAAGLVEGGVELPATSVADLFD